MQDETTPLPYSLSTSRHVCRTPAASSLTPQIQPSDFAVLHTSPVLSETLLIDLSHSNGVLHSIHSGACSSHRKPDCNSIHYGFCSPVSNATGSLSSWQQVNNDHTQPSKSLSSSLSSRPVCCIDDSLSDRLHLSSAFDLIADEEKSFDLQNLLNQFVSTEKMKQQARNSQTLVSNKQFANLRPVSNRLSQSVGNLNTTPNQQAAWQKFLPNYIRSPSTESSSTVQPVAPQKAASSADRSHHLPNAVIQPQALSSYRKVKPDQNVSVPKDNCNTTAGNNRCNDQIEISSPVRGDGPTSKGLDHSQAAQYEQQNHNTRIFGLSSKANKNKYLQLANSRQSANARVSEAPVSSNLAKPHTLAQASDAPDSPKILSPSESVGRLLNDRFADQLMQLTDDEKVQYIIASHTRQQSSREKHSPISSPDASSTSDQRNPLLGDKQPAKPKLRETPKNNFLQPRVHQPPNSNLSKFKSLSCDSLSNKNLIDFKSYQGPQMIDYSSPFDYAKTRFINSFILSGLKVPDNKRLTPSQNLVSETRSKLLEKNVVTPKQSPDAGDCKPGFRRTPVDANVIKIPVRNPVKPYLSRGSVAERVLLFEKCPEIQAQRRSLVQTTRRSKSPVLYRHWKNPSKATTTESKEESDDKIRSKALTRRLIKQSSTAVAEIPKFYFPSGKPYTSLEIEKCLYKIRSEFEKLPGKCVIAKNDISRITKACGLPLSWKEPLRQAVIGNRHSSHRMTEPVDVTKESKITCEEFLEFWRNILSSHFDEASRFVAILSRGQRKYLVPEDFISMIQDVVECHPGLTFLKEAMEFHSRYVHTVIARIFYCVNRSWSGRLTASELRKSNFLEIVALLDEEEDINQITEYFSYEHFYVIYCKFWELDKDHDLIIDKHDLSRHNDSAISVKMIDRIFSGAVTRGPVLKYGKMTYAEFVWFLISEEDKSHPRAIEYWFRCMDLDGDGFLSIYELEWFYTEQSRRLEAMGIEPLPFTDTLCQMLDMIRPQAGDKISLSDLKKSKMTPIFFDTFFNLEKYLDHEQKDPFAAGKMEEEISDWDRFAAEEYEILVAEESQPASQKTDSAKNNSSSSDSKAKS